jgi:hypothetical protein
MVFYVLARRQVISGDAITDFLWVEPIKRKNAPQCRLCGGFIGGKPHLPPVRVNIETWGSSYGDMAFGPSDQILISERFKEEYHTHGLTGLSDFELVEVARVLNRKKIRDDCPKYFLASVTRSRTAIDVEASGLVHEKPPTCLECKGGLIKRTERIVLEEGTWSGEDIFFARGLPGTIIVSDKFRRMCIEAELQNCPLLEASLFSFDFYRWETVDKTAR